MPDNVHSTRPDLAPRLARGRLASELPRLLAAVFTLCGHAHRITAERAVRAAQGLGDTAVAGTGQALQLATAREQVLRLVNDWPAGGHGINQDIDPAGEASRSAHHALRSCPLWRPDLAPAEQLAELPGWLQHQWLGMSPPDWLRHHDEDPLDWPARWAGRCAGHHPLARWLHRVQARAAALRTPSRPLTLLDEVAASMPALALRLQPGGAASAWAGPGGVPDTGPWSRHHALRPLPAHNAWVRLTSRVTDVLHLAAPEGGQWLAHGAHALGDGQGMAWAETARGLLVHWVQLQDHADGPRVADCRVLAPTDWNFHPRGVLAEALQALPSDLAVEDQAADARLLALAFDPCVAFDVETHTPQREAAHA